MSRASLYSSHARLADQIANKYLIPGADREDVQQEARIALWIATGTYRAGRGATFRTWAGWVIKAHLNDELKAARREKRRSINESSGPEQLELLPTHSLESVVIARETLAEIVSQGPDIKRRRQRWGQAKRRQRAA